MDILSKNKHVEYPQNIFEQGLVTVKKDGKIMDYERLAALSIFEKADYTKTKQNFDCLMKMLGIEYSLEEIYHNTFIQGRVGRIIVKGKKVGYIGEINPKVIYNFNLEFPIVGFEINITEIFKAINK